MELFKKLLLASGVAFFVALQPASASTLDELWDGMNANIGNPGMFKGQTMDHFVGGSASIRVPKKSYQLASMSGPSIGAGCGGIDLYAGSFSFLNSDELVQMFQNIANNAVGAIFKLALDSVSPQLGGVIDYMNDLAQKVNALNVDSCRAAEGIITMAKERGKKSEEENELSMLGSGLKNIWTDIRQAKEKIGNNIEEKKAARKEIKKDPKEKKKLEDVNLTWEALRKVKFAGGSVIPDEEARLVASLFGAVICEEDKSKPGDEESENPRSCTYYEETLGIESFMGATEGFAVSAANCKLSTGDSKGRCLSNDYAQLKEWGMKPSGQSETYRSFKEYVLQEMNYLRDSIKARNSSSAVPGFGDVRLQRAYGLVAMSSIPTWQLIKLASTDLIGEVYYESISTSIASDIAYNYISALASQLEHGLNELERIGDYTGGQAHESEFLAKQRDTIKTIIKDMASYRKATHQEFANIAEAATNIKVLSNSFEDRVRHNYINSVGE